MGAADLGLSVAAGALTTLSPCVFPLLPLVVGGGLQRHPAAPLAMGAGMTLSFAIAGLVVGSLGEALGIDGDSVRQFGAALLVAFGIVMLVPALDAAFSRLVSPLATSADRAASGWRSETPLGAFAVGSLLGLVWSPCSGPLLGSTLGLLAGGGALRGALLLGLFGAGAAVPLVLAAYASRRGFGRARGWVLANATRLKKIFGTLLLVAGLATLSGADKWLEAQVNARLPDAWLSLTTRF